MTENIFIPIAETRFTSIESYYLSLNIGTISAKRRDALDVLCRHATARGLTANEVWNIYRREQRTTINFYSNTRARFTELREMGLIMEVGEKECSITGRNCIAWAPTWETEVKDLRRRVSAKTMRKALLAVWKHADCTDALRNVIRKAVGS